jgi:hypothetical protein
VRTGPPAAAVVGWATAACGVPGTATATTATSVLPRRLAPAVRRRWSCGGCAPLVPRQQVHELLPLDAPARVYAGSSQLVLQLAHAPGRGDAASPAGGGGSGNGSSDGSRGCLPAAAWVRCRVGRVLPRGQPRRGCDSTRERSSTSSERGSSSERGGGRGVCGVLLLRLVLLLVLLLLQVVRGGRAAPKLRQRLVAARARLGARVARERRRPRGRVGRREGWCARRWRRGPARAPLAAAAAGPRVLNDSHVVVVAGRWHRCARRWRRGPARAPLVAAAADRPVLNDRHVVVAVRWCARRWRGPARAALAAAAAARPVLDECHVAVAAAAGPVLNYLHVVVDIAALESVAEKDVRGGRGIEEGGACVCVCLCLCVRAAPHRPFSHVGRP